MSEYLPTPSGPSAFDKHDDVTYPLHLMDHGQIIRESIINYTFRYDAILDVEKLRASLVRLLETGDWRKLGGRLRLNKDGNMEIKVPQPFTADRPAIRFSQANWDLEINQHPVGCRLPRKTGDCPSVQEGCHAFRCFIAPADLPNTIQHYLTTDDPMITLYISSFLDATVVSLTFPHTLTDAMGTGDLLRAWSAVLADRPDQVPPVFGAREDVLSAVGTWGDKKAQTPFALEEMQLKGLSMLAFVVRNVWDMFTRRSTQARTIFLSARFMARLRQAAQADDGLGADETPPFVSDGDLIAAWESRMILASRPNKPAIICNVFDMRHRIHGTFKPSGTAAYLQKLVLAMVMILPSTGSTASLHSVGHIARKLRQTLMEQTTDTQIRSRLRVYKNPPPLTGTYSVFGTSDSLLIIITNWSKARLREAADFGPAVVSPSSHPGEPGLPVSYWGGIVGANDNLRNMLIVYGKDGEGNYWGQAYFESEVWDRIEAEFAEYA